MVSLVEYFYLFLSVFLCSQILFMKKNFKHTLLKSRRKSYLFFFKKRFSKQWEHRERKSSMMKRGLASILGMW